MVQDEARGGALPALAVGVLAVGSAAVIVRLAGAPALALSFWRCALGAGLLLPVALARREKFPAGRALYAAVASGVVLGLHFWVWIGSLSYTSVAASAVLVSSAPVFVAALAYLFLGEKTGSLSLFGILVSLAGAALIASDGSFGEAALFGNLLALSGALAFAVYVLIGRSSRGEGVGALSYSVVAYGSAAATLLAAALLFGVGLLSYPRETWFWILALALGPQVLGHTLFNWALGHVEASVVAGVTLGEPVVAAVLARVFLDESPGLLTLVGGAVVLLGLYFLLRGARKPAA